MKVTARMEVFIRQQKNAALCSGQTHHTWIYYPGLASLEGLILPGPRQAAQVRVSSFHGQPAELWETSAAPGHIFFRLSSSLTFSVPASYLGFPLQSIHCFDFYSLLPVVGSLQPQRKTLSMTFKCPACHPATLTSCRVCHSSGISYTAPSLKNNFPLLVHLWTLF